MKISKSESYYDSPGLPSFVDGLSQLLKEIVCNFPKSWFLHLRFKSNRYTYILRKPVQEFEPFILALTIRDFDLTFTFQEERYWQILVCIVPSLIDETNIFVFPYNYLSFANQNNVFFGMELTTRKAQNHIWQQNKKIVVCSASFFSLTKWQSEYELFDKSYGTYVFQTNLLSSSISCCSNR